MNIGSTFSGIAGFDLGFERAGFNVLWQVEIDRDCRKLLSSKFPRATLYSDIRSAGLTAKLKPNHHLEPIDILLAGWPCQGNSVAGRRGGLADPRSGLFREIPRLARELSPLLIIWENVPGLLSVNKGRDFALCLLALAQCGYVGAWRCLDVQYFGIPQRRRRPFGVFARSDFGTERLAQILSLAEGLRRHPAPGKETGKTIAGTIGGSSQSGGFRTTDLDNSGAFICASVTSKWAKGSGGPSGDECQNLIATLAASGAGTQRPAGQHNELDYLIRQKFGVRRLTPIECERLQGFPDGWTAGFSDSARYRMLGNAVNVAVAEWIARRVKSVL